jgi:hypothetical protein
MRIVSTLDHTRDIGKLTQHLAVHSIITLTLLNRHRHAPAQIPRDRSRKQPTFQPWIDYLALAIDDRIRRPLPRFPRFPEPFFRLGLDFVKLEVHVL